MENQKKLLVSAIKEGTVIDHIAVGGAIKIIKLLSLASHKKTVAVGLNLKGRTNLYKDIVKVEGRTLTREEADRIAVFSPNATINIIKNYEIKKKFKVKIPKTIETIIVCLNPKCITNHEEIKTKFNVFYNGDKKIKLKCHYCEKVFKNDDIKEYNI